MLPNDSKPVVLINEGIRRTLAILEEISENIKDETGNIQHFEKELNAATFRKESHQARTTDFQAELHDLFVAYTKLTGYTHSLCTTDDGSETPSSGQGNKDSSAGNPVADVESQLGVRR